MNDEGDCSFIIHMRWCVENKQIWQFWNQINYKILNEKQL